MILDHTLPRLISFAGMESDGDPCRWGTSLVVQPEGIYGVEGRFRIDDLEANKSLPHHEQARRRETLQRMFRKLGNGLAGCHRTVQQEEAAASNSSGLFPQCGDRGNNEAVMPATRTTAGGGARRHGGGADYGDGNKLQKSKSLPDSAAAAFPKIGLGPIRTIKTSVNVLGPTIPYRRARSSTTNTTTAPYSSQKRNSHHVVPMQFSCFDGYRLRGLPKGYALVQSRNYPTTTTEKAPLYGSMSRTARALAADSCTEYSMAIVGSSTVTSFSSDEFIWHLYWIWTGMAGNCRCYHCSGRAQEDRTRQRIASLKRKEIEEEEAGEHQSTQAGGGGGTRTTLKVTVVKKEADNEEDDDHTEGGDDSDSDYESDMDTVFGTTEPRPRNAKSPSRSSTLESTTTSTHLAAKLASLRLSCAACCAKAASEAAVACDEHADAVVWGAMSESPPTTKNWILKMST